MDEVVAPVLQCRNPVAVVDNVELPQLLTTVTTGAAGAVTGAVTAVSATLVQPLTVWVSVQVVAADVTIALAPDPLFQCKVPV